MDFGTSIPGMLPERVTQGLLRAGVEYRPCRRAIGVGKSVVYDWPSRRRYVEAKCVASVTAQDVTRIVPACVAMDVGKSRV